MAPDEAVGDFLERGPFGARHYSNNAFRPSESTDCPISAVVARLTSNQKVEGSTPSWGGTFFLCAPKTVASCTSCESLKEIVWKTMQIYIVRLYYLVQQNQHRFIG